MAPTINPTKANATAAPAAPKAKAEKKPKNKVTRKFVGQNGELQVVTKKLAPNNIQTYVVHIKLTDELTSKGKQKRKKIRGASQLHKDETAAKSAVDAIVAQATKMGWLEKSRKNGAVAPKADAFDLAHLPSAAGSVIKK